jgi:polyferredoxin
MTKYALSEDMEQIDWIWIFFSLCILYYWHEYCEIFLCFYFTPSPQLLAIIHRRGVQSHRVDQAEVSNASRVCKNIKPWELQNLLIECSTF